MFLLRKFKKYPLRCFVCGVWIEKTPLGVSVPDAPREGSLDVVALSYRLRVFDGIQGEGGDQLLGLVSWHDGSGYGHHTLPTRTF